MSYLVSSAWAADQVATATSTALEPGETDFNYTASPEKMMMDNLFVLGLLFFIFYFILIRPQQKRLKAHKEMLGKLEKGARVMTQGGIYGTIVKFEGDHVVVLEVAPEVRIRVAKSSIADTVDDASPKTANDN